MRPAMLGVIAAVMWVMMIGMAQAKPPESWQDIQIKPNPYDGWALEQIKADPGFHPLGQPSSYGSWWFPPLRIDPPSSARESAALDAPPVYQWIGFIELPEDYGRYMMVVFDKTGAGVTMVSGCNAPYDDPVPVWFVGTLGYLSDRGVLGGYP